MRCNDRSASVYLDSIINDLDKAQYRIVPRHGQAAEEENMTHRDMVEGKVHRKYKVHYNKWY